MPPIKVKFEIPYFTVSGMQVGPGHCTAVYVAQPAGCVCMICQ